MGGAEGCWATVSTMIAILCPQHHSQQLSHSGLHFFPSSTQCLSCYHRAFAQAVYTSACSLSPQPAGSSFMGGLSSRSSPCYVVIPRGCAVLRSGAGVYSVRTIPAPTLAPTSCPSYCGSLRPAYSGLFFFFFGGSAGN